MKLVEQNDYVPKEAHDFVIKQRDAAWEVIKELKTQIAEISKGTTK